MPRRYRRSILKHVSEPDYHPMRVRDLARSMKVPDEQYDLFRSAVSQLVQEGAIVFGSRGRVALPRMSGRVVGTYRATSRGFGFVKPDTPVREGELFIPIGESLDAMDGDRVVAKVLRRKGVRRGQMLHTGRIVQVISRARHRFVGKLQRYRGRWYIEPFGAVTQQPIYIDDASTRFARPGQTVVVEMVSFPRLGVPGYGAIVEVLEKTAEMDVDTLAVIRQFELPDSFSDEAMAVARAAVRRLDQLRRHRPDDRQDLRGLLTVTVDPAEARDFDDAISVQRTGTGFVLGVHIADVCFFVEPNTSLDAEAELRGNSVYFPRHVLPMLPEILSNGVCSLQPGRLRPCKSVFIHYDRQGRIIRRRFANSLIRSSARLTYEQVGRILEGKTGRYRPALVQMLRDAAELAELIQRRRLEEGMLVLDLPEVELLFDKDGKLVDAVPEQRDFPHTMIEMFMVEANRCVAELLDGLGVAFLRRIHPEPEPAAVKKLRRLLNIYGFKLQNTDRRSLQSLLESVRGRDEAFLVNMAVLRSMQQAQYSPLAIGHYALAYRHYCHFTSPIRRYPDLCVHRVLELYLRGRLTDHGPTGPEQDIDRLAEIGEHCSFTERRAEQAEEELRLVKVLELLAERVGEEIDVVVTGISNYGIFAQCKRFLVEGLMRFDQLDDDEWWEANPESGLAVAPRSGVAIRISQSMRARIVRVDVARRQLDLLLLYNGSKSAARVVSKARKRPRRRRRR